jgi:hypothetical protein
MEVEREPWFVIRKITPTTEEEEKGVEEDHSWERVWRYKVMSGVANSPDLTYTSFRTRPH